MNNELLYNKIDVVRSDKDNIFFVESTHIHRNQPVQNKHY